MSDVTNGKGLPNVPVDSLSEEAGTPGQRDQGHIDQGQIDPVSREPQSQRAISTDNNASVSLWKLPVMEKEEDLKREDVKTKLARLEREAYEKVILFFHGFILYIRRFVKCANGCFI